jgi:AraC-like DNA-binding protein
LPYHSSHESISLKRSEQKFEIKQGWTIRFDDEPLHIIQQFFASIIQVLVGFTGAAEPLLTKLNMVPHPEFGFDHLAPWFHTRPTVSKDPSLRLVIPAEIADRRFFKVARDRTGGKIPAGASRLGGGLTLGETAKAVIQLHLTDGAPSVERLASSAGLTKRTLQRQLAIQKTSFSNLLEDVRMELAVHNLEAGQQSMDDIAAKLGYAGQSTLTRAVRRWTGETPRSIRKSAAS